MFGFLKRKRPPEPGRSAIVPRIKHTNFLRALEGMGVPSDQRPHTEPFVADLLVTYAFDLPGTFLMATPADLRRLAIEPGELRSIALANLKRQLPEIGLADEPPLMRVVTGNNLEACALLADAFWDRLDDSVPGQLVVAVPSRDVVLVASTEPGEGLRVLRERADAARRANPTHSLSDCLLTRQHGAWAIFRTGTRHPEEGPQR